MINSLDLDQGLTKAKTRGDLCLRCCPTVLLATASLIQVAIWAPPEELRWDGSLVGEWPIAWMTCCNSQVGFIGVLITFGLACVTGIFKWTAMKHGFRWFDLAMFVSFPVAIYLFLYGHYFG